VSFKAETNRVLIASPSDLPEERKAASDAVGDWNALHAAAEGVVLLPVMWETHSYPVMGMRPQEVINRQLVRDADILVALFKARIGTHTGVAQSGTVEEIDQFVEASKPAMLYWSTGPVDLSTIDVSQLDRLRDFKRSTYDHALTGNFASPDDLRYTLMRNLVLQVRELTAGRPRARRQPPHAAAMTDLIASHQRQMARIAEERDEALRQLAMQTEALQARIEDLARPGLQFFVEDPDAPPYWAEDPFSPGQFIARVGLRTTGLRTVKNVEVRLVRAIPSEAGVRPLTIDWEAILEIQGGTPPWGVDVSDGHLIYPQVVIVREREQDESPEVRVHYADPGLMRGYSPLPVGEWLLTLVATGEDVVSVRRHFVLTITDSRDPRKRASLRMEPDDD